MTQQLPDWWCNSASMAVWEGVGKERKIAVAPDHETAMEIVQMRRFYLKAQNRADKLDALLGYIFATLRTNLLRETIKTADDSDFERIIQDWQKQREEA